MGRHKKKQQNKRQNNNKKHHLGKHPQSQQNAIFENLEAAEHILNDQYTSANHNKHNKYSKNNKNNKHNKNVYKQNNNKHNKWKQKSNYKSELNQFLDQLRPLGLGIRNARSDGNCLFRAISDQISGDENNQSRFRKQIVSYMRQHNDEFAPFYVGNYDTYLNKMSKNGIWGGNMELTAAAKTFHIDIVIHSLNAARYEILYQTGKPKRTIHLSYHNEKHYASVRRLDDMTSNKPAKIINLDKNYNEKLQREQQRAEIAWCHNGGNPLQIENAKNDLLNLSKNEQLVVARTNCYDIIKVKEALKYLDGNIDAAVESIMIDMSLMANEQKEKTIKELEKQKEDEKNEKKNKHNKKKDNNIINKKNENDKKECESKCDDDNVQKCDLKSVVVVNENLNLKLDDIKVDLDTKTECDMNQKKVIVNENINSKIKCIENGCNFEHELLLLYLKHYKFMHLRGGKIVNKNLNDKEDKMCPFGHKCECKASLCTECGWDLRYKPIIPKHIQKKIQSEAINKPICKPKISEPICKAMSKFLFKPIYNTSSKYKKYMNKYWICNQCTFVNPNTNINCMVCSMLNNIKCDYNIINNNNEIQYDNWVSMAIENNKQNNKPIKQKQKNIFGWICDQCTYENKPSNQICICGNNKPKKKGKKNNKKQKNKAWKCKRCSKTNNMKSICDACGNTKDSVVTNVYYADSHYDFDETDLKNELDSYNDNNKWSIKGNDKCKCGSGNKYKKCCKKLEKHDKSWKNKFKHPEYHNKYNNNGYNNIGDPIDELNKIIVGAERDIKDFKGKKYIKIQMIKKLEQMKDRRNALINIRNKNRNNKTQNRNKNKHNTNQVYINNGNNNNNNNTVANTTIAI